MNKRKLGNKYEQQAIEYLKSIGYVILESNYSSRTGEIDIIARDGEYYVFIEVKYRTNTSHGMPEEAVDMRKMKHITKTARLYLCRHGLSEFTPCRFDVVAILNDTTYCIKDAFEAAD